MRRHDRYFSRRVGALSLSVVLVFGGCDRLHPGEDEAERSMIANASAIRARADSADRIRQDSIVRAQPGYVVDSILPIEEEIRRFQAAVGVRPKAFSNGATSRSALVSAFVTAVERGDAAALHRLVVDSTEFGYLVYPSSPNTVAPHKQSPQIVWFLRSAATAKGADRLLARLGGRAFGYVDTRCPDTADRQGANTVWTGCVVTRVGADGDTARLTLFGPIIERDGHFKFLSLANGL